MTVTGGTPAGGRRMISKIELLMEETGCDQGEAELALEMCGYEVEAAAKALPRLLKNILVIKSKFRDPEAGRFGLLLIILNAKTRALLRARAVLSYHPAVYTARLDKGWFEFEKGLYGCRLWEGSLPNESLEIEHALTQRFRGEPQDQVFDPGDEGLEAAASEVGKVLRRVLRSPAVDLRVLKEVLDLGQFQSLDADDPAERLRPAAVSPTARPAKGAGAPLVLKVGLESDPEGTPARELRAGDVVYALIADPRDIAQYLARLFGCQSDKGPQPLMAPVEAVDATAESVTARLRFAVGVCGEAHVFPETRLRVERSPGRAAEAREGLSWWKKLLGGKEAQ